MIARVLEMAILGLLKSQDMHGYELKRRLGEVLGSQGTVSFGSLYPALAKLERMGAVEVVAHPLAPESPPPERTAKRASLLGRRQRKVYRLTASGSELFDQLLAGPLTGTEDDRSFNSRLAFAAHLDPEKRLGLLEGRRRVLAERLARARTTASRADKYLAILVAREREALGRDLSWIDQLITEERAALVGTDERAGTRIGHNLPPVPLASASQLRRSRTPAPAT
jgi:DNA-binding PadR family transcriptional regulator